ncbi:MAG TPA: hypothetical protein VG125_29405 [Pirellulales bacterium]|jgi:hypothetical protein|nr:hypothetical protein [Pirellulales bacterium]
MFGLISTHVTRLCLHPLSLVALWLTSAGTAHVAADTFEIEVREPAGIRRFGYPVAVVLPIPPSAPKTIVCALHDAGRDLAAQLRREETDDGSGRWWLDFNLDLMPHESRALKLEYGEGLVANSEPRGGLTLSESPDEYQVSNGNHIHWTVGRQPGPVVKQVRVPTYEHLRDRGMTLAWTGLDGARHELVGDGGKATSMRLVRAGPLAVVVRSQVALPEISDQARSVVDMTFPVSKSWVEVDWRIEGVAGGLVSASAEIDLNLDRPAADKPTLVDFGASTLVYLALDPGQSGVLRSTRRSSSSSSAGGGVKGPSGGWEVLRGAPGKLEPFVASLTTHDQRLAAEGWAHVMDRTRCLAVALDEFGHDADDSIEVTAEGKVVLTRRFPAGAADGAARSLRYWLHFVGFPPHQTAATSPQSMLAPLVVRVRAE